MMITIIVMITMMMITTTMMTVMMQLVLMILILFQVFSDGLSAAGPVPLQLALPSAATDPRSSSYSRRPSLCSDAQQTFVKSSVSFAFREQLTQLVTILKSTAATYIRCIKPNSSKRPLQFDSLDILRQLKCAGMLESIRIRKTGYSIRIGIYDFIKRYG